MIQKAFKSGVGLLAFGVAVAVSSQAQAQSLGGRQDVVLGVERVFGLYSARIVRERGNDDIVTRSSSVGLAFQEPVMPLAVPRVAFDYFITQQLSLGGSLGFYSQDPGEDPGILNDDSGGFLFAPRVGYAIPFNTEWGVWFRGGLTYFSWEADNDDSVSLMALTGEATFYFMPAPSVGFTGGPLMDLGFAGDEQFGVNEGDFDARLLGIGFGMFARF
jgi:hypothetical protein